MKATKKNTVNNATVNNTTKAERNREALKAAGIDVSNIFSLQGDNDILVRMEDGKLSIIEDNDPIFKKLEEAGTIANPDLYRRWIMAQVFHGLLRKGGFTQYMKDHGYEYTWKMIENEFATQVKMHRHQDISNFKERNRFFNKAVVVSMAEEYVQKLKDLVEDLPVRHCKNKAYKRVLGKNIFVTDLDKKLYKPLEKSLDKIKKAVIPEALYSAVYEFNKNRRKFKHDTTQNKAWQNAYKGVGAYYTLKNMLLFHGNFVKGNGKTLYGQKGLDFVNQKAEEYKNEGWRLFGVFNKAIKDNNIDVAAEIASWRK